MEFKALKIFTTVAQVGSISKAAKLLHSVQSNISARILQLEDQLDTQLFIRESRGMRLTPAGEILNNYAQRLLSLGEEAYQAVTASTLGRGILRLGTIESTLAIRMPSQLRQFTNLYPDIELDIQTGTTDYLIDAVINYQVDGAIIAGEINSQHIKSVPVFVEDIVLITPIDVNSIELALYKKLVVFRQGCAYRSFAEQWLREQGISPIRITELGTLDGIFSCIAAGVGITCLPRSVAESYVKTHQINVHTIDGERAKININAIMNAELKPHPAFMLLLDLIDE